MPIKTFSLDCDQHTIDLPEDAEILSVTSLVGPVLVVQSQDWLAATRPRTFVVGKDFPSPAGVASEQCGVWLGTVARTRVQAAGLPDVREIVHVLEAHEPRPLSVPDNHLTDAAIQPGAVLTWDGSLYDVVARLTPPRGGEVATLQRQREDRVFVLSIDVILSSSSARLHAPAPSREVDPERPAIKHRRTAPIWPTPPCPGRDILIGSLRRIDPGIAGIYSPRTATRIRAHHPVEVVRSSRHPYRVFVRFTNQSASTLLVPTEYLLPA